MAKPSVLRRDFFAPDNLSASKTEACRELAYFDADSPEVIETYQNALADPSPESAILMNLYALGPQASNAKS